MANYIKNFDRLFGTASTINSSSNSGGSNKYKKDVLLEIDGSLYEAQRLKKLNTDPRTPEELFGSDWDRDKNIYFREPEYPNERYLQTLQLEEDWNEVVNADVYAHIRLCGRRSQIASEDRAFLLDDLFRMYPYGTYHPVKYTYNKDAHFWVFYIGVLVQERELFIWVQTPNSTRARKFVYKGLSRGEGLKLAPNPRDKSAIKRYVDPYEDELKDLTTKYYEVFDQAFKQVKINFERILDMVENLPQNSFAEWPYGGLLYL